MEGLLALSTKEFCDDEREERLLYDSEARLSNPNDEERRLFEPNDVDGRRGVSMGESECFFI